MSNRGQYSLFNAFEKPTIQPQIEEDRQRNYLQPERNTLLVSRYYFYGWIKDFKYGRCLSELEKEFFLSERRLQDLLASVDDQLRNLHVTKPTVKDLQNKYPWLNWNV